MFVGADGCIVAVAGDGALVCVDAAVMSIDSGVRVGGRSVLIGVRKTGVNGVRVTIGVPVVPAKGQVCNATGKSKQLDASEQIFKLKLVNGVPWQTNTLLPLTTSAVRQVTGVLVSTSKIAKSGKIKTAWANPLTQN